MTVSVEAGDSPVRHLFAQPRITTRQAVDGSLILASADPLKDYTRCVGDWLEQAAKRVPDRIFLAERPRADAPWRQLTYGEALSQVRTVAGWLLDNGLDATRSVAILSENSVDHAVLMLAAMHVGIPVASISPAYSLISKSCEKLKDMIALLDPGVIFVSNASAYQPALTAIKDLHRARVIASVPAGPSEELFSSLRSNSHAAVARAFAKVTPDTMAKLLFTSGSTGSPKAVINTQRMMTSNQEARAQIWPFLEATDDLVILDWLPWSHTFGANHNFNCVLRNHGTLYIDGGKPVPGLFELSLANLRETSPTIYFNVPLGFEMLVQALAKDASLRQRFFSQTRVILYAAAALPQNTWEVLETMSRETVGHVVPLVSAWGATETAPMATDCHFQAPRSGNIGVPVPGTELKLVPAGDKLEVRVRGPNVTPGYWKSPEQTQKAFDEEGFYMIGDALALVDPGHPEKGLFFNGRVSEDFKLLSGTWVSVGRLRVDGVAALAPVAQDIVVTGHDKKDVGFLIFPNLPTCRSIGRFADDVPVAEVLASPAIRDRIAQGLATLKARGGGSSMFARYALLLSEPPSVDQGEITDKGYINQRAVLARRVEALAKLYDDGSVDRIECPER
ncbi:MAG TPA: feruloyl-CoA synthase [Beijerinckiaceae bacterium]|jgi:feruloyl-CoA synthase|nr:feruloyl-CoA synthase [Beijerinckiaceae bacterium]